MWFDVESMPLDFTERSPFHIENEVVINAPPARVFEILTNGRDQGAWFQDFVACRWTTPEPYGVGSEREIELKMLTVKERFLAWEPGKRLSFTIYAITIPLASAMLEDMILEPAGDGKTLFRWRAHYRPSLLMKLVHPIGRAIFGKMFKASIEGLKRHAESKRS